MKPIFFILIFLLIAKTILAQKNYSTGLLFDKTNYDKIRSQKMSRSLEKFPRSISLKEYCPNPQEQGDYQNCVGWAVGYASCTISEAIAKNIQDKSILTDMATSPAYVYAYGKQKDDLFCKMGVYIEAVLINLKEKVIPRHRKMSEICTSSDNLSKNYSTGIQITDFVKVFQGSDESDIKLSALKQALVNKHPIVAGILFYKSFMNTKKVWSGDLDVNVGSGHAICIIGYDDDLEGGSFQIMNSWGTGWGENGFGWIRYKDLDNIIFSAVCVFIKITDNQSVSNTIVSNTKSDLASNIELKLPEENITIPLKTAISRNLNPTPDKLSTISKPITIFKTENGYSAGTKFKIYIDITKPTYLYVLGSDETGQINKIFPVDSTMSPYLANAATQIVLPDEKWSIELDNTKGTDYLIFVYSKTELPIDVLLANWNHQQDKAFNKIKQAFSDKTQKMENIRLSNNRIIFNTPIEDKKIVIIGIEMNHF